MKVKKQYTSFDGNIINIPDTTPISSIFDILKPRIGKEKEEVFFDPNLSHLLSPLLLPDIEVCSKRVLEAQKNNERVVIFWDYDVDGVSSTALLVRFLKYELGMQVSYRLPHRQKDGYGLKSYFFDELKEKNVSLVITVDCGTKDIEPIQHAKSLGIDVIVTDHHAVPEKIPKEVIGIINPKRIDVPHPYPFPYLAGAGVAFKFAYAILLFLYAKDPNTPTKEERKKIESILMKYADFSSLGTVADCMPLIWENRIITQLGLRQMQQSQSAGLKKFIENCDDVEWNADLIGFQIGPRINASGRMDTPMTALQWLLASEQTCDGFFETIEVLNNSRKEEVKSYSDSALMNADPNDGILFFVDDTISHGLIGLVAGKLTETYNRPAIVLAKHKETNKEWKEIQVMVASCRSPEWCSMIDLLDASKEFFLRYGGHKQAAWLSIESEKFPQFKKHIQNIFAQKYDTDNLPKPSLEVIGILPIELLNLESFDTIQRFRPFWIGNPHPVWFLAGVTLRDHSYIGAKKNHIRFYIQENPNIVFLMWNAEHCKDILKNENQYHLVVELQKNTWKETSNLQVIVREIIIA